MAEYRYYLIPDFMSHVFPQQFVEQAPTEFFSNTADLMKRYKQLREMPYNNEYTWNERTNLPYPRLTVGKTNCTLFCLLHDAIQRTQEISSSHCKIRNKQNQFAVRHSIQLLSATH